MEKYVWENVVESQRLGPGGRIPESGLGGAEARNDQVYKGTKSEDYVLDEATEFLNLGVEALRTESCQVIHGVD